MGEYLMSVVGGLILAVFGFMLTRNAKMHDEAMTSFTKDVIRLKKELNEFDQRLRSAMSRAEVRELLDDKLAPIQVLLQEIKEDIRNVRHNKDSD